MGHTAKQGCCHCKKEFPGGFGKQKNYGGFDDRDEWPKRSSEQHRRDAYRVKNCRSENAAEKLASQLGVRYTVLFELPYYTSIEMCVIDPMHNLFLGTAKRVFSKWIEEDIITKAGLKRLQERIEGIPHYQILEDFLGTSNQIMVCTLLLNGRILSFCSQCML